MKVYLENRFFIVEIKKELFQTQHCFLVTAFLPMNYLQC